MFRTKCTPSTIITSNTSRSTSIFRSLNMSLSTRKSMCPSWKKSTFPSTCRSTSKAGNTVTSTVTIPTGGNPCTSQYNNQHRREGAPWIYQVIVAKSGSPTNIRLSRDSEKIKVCLERIQNRLCAKCATIRSGSDLFLDYMIIDKCFIIIILFRISYKLHA